MKVKQLLSDDDAVSPVIGVILMVAITVILAAVIATFVLGLGDQVSDTSPQASFSFDWNGDSDGGADTLNITHNGGDTITAKNIYIRGDVGTNGNGNILGDTWDEYGDAESGSEITAGNRIKVGENNNENIGSDGEVDVIYEQANGDTSATLGSWEGPEA